MPDQYKALCQLGWGGQDPVQPLKHPHHIGCLLLVRRVLPANHVETKQQPKRIGHLQLLLAPPGLYVRVIEALPLPPVGKQCGCQRHLRRNTVRVALPFQPHMQEVFAIPVSVEAVIGIVKDDAFCVRGKCVLKLRDLPEGC